MILEDLDSFNLWTLLMQQMLNIIWMGKYCKVVNWLLFLLRRTGKNQLKWGPEKEEGTHLQLTLVLLYFGSNETSMFVNVVLCFFAPASSRGNSRGRVYDRRRSPPRYSRSPRYSSRSPPPSRGREYYSPKRRYSRLDVLICKASLVCCRHPSLQSTWALLYLLCLLTYT